MNTRRPRSPSLPALGLSKGRKLLLAAPALGALAAAPASHATIVYTNPPDLTASSPNNIFFDLGANGGTGSSSLSSFPAADFYLKFYYNTQPLVPMLRFAVNGNLLAASGGFVTNFPYGTSINSSLFSTQNYIALNNAGANNAHWPANGSPGYVGLEFNGGSGPVFGWAQVSYNSNHSLTLYDFAYQSDGSPILAGQTAAVPEPAESAAFAALLAGSAAAFAARRRRKLHQAA